MQRAGSLQIREDIITSSTCMEIQKKSQIMEDNCSKKKPKKTKGHFIFLGSLTELAQQAFPDFPFILLQKHHFPQGENKGEGVGKKGASPGPGSTLRPTAPRPATPSQTSCRGIPTPARPAPQQCPGWFCVRGGAGSERGGEAACQRHGLIPESGEANSWGRAWEAFSQAGRAL